MAEVLPPAVLDLIVNTAEWIAGLEEALGALEEFNSVLAETEGVLGSFSAEVTTAMEETASATEAASEAIIAGMDEAAAAYDRVAEAADASAAAAGRAAETSEAAATKSAASAEEMGGAGMGASLDLGKAALAIGAVGVASLTAAGDFQKAMTQLVTSADESKDAIALVSKGVMDMATQVGFSSVQLGKALYPIDSAGYHAADSLTVLKAAAQGAKDENADLYTVANALTTLMKDYSIPVNQSADAMSKLVTAVSFGKTNLQAMSTAMSNLLPVAQGAHLQFSDVVSVLAEMTSKGTTAQKAALDIQNAIKSLETPTTAMTKQFKEFGISAQDVVSHLNKDGLGGTLNWLQGIADKSAASIGETTTGAMKKLIGTAPGLQAMLETTGGSFHDVQKAMDAVNGSMADAQGNVIGFSKVQGNLNFTFDQFKAEVENVAISIGNAMMPATEGLFKLLGNLFDEIGKSSDFKDAMTGIVSAISDSFKALEPVMAPLMAAFKDFVKIAGALLVDALKILAPMLSVVLTAFDDLMKAIEPLLPVIQTIAEELGKAWGQAFQQILDAIVPLLPPLTDLVQVALKNLADILPIILPAWLKLAKAFEDIIPALAPLLPMITDFVKSMSPFLIMLAQGSALLVGGLAQGISDAVKPVAEALKITGDALDWLVKLPDQLKPVSGAVKGAIGNVVFNVKAGTDNAAAAAKVGGKKIGDNLNGGVASGYAQVYQVINELPNRIGYGLGQVLGTIVKWSAQMGNAIISGVKNGSQALFRFFEIDLPKKIQDSIAGAETWLKENGKQVIDGFIRGLVEKALDLYKWWQDLPNKLNSLLTTANIWLVQKGRDIVQGAINGISQMNEEFMRWFFGLEARIFNALSNAGNWLVNTGYSIMSGLWHGIVSGWNWLMGQISSIADSIKRGFMDALGINSPSRVMADNVGFGIVEGIAKGMTDNMHFVHNAVGNVRSALTGMSSGVNAGYGIGLPAGVGNVGGGGAGGIVVINNNVQGSVLAEQELQQLVQTQTLRYNGRNPTNGLKLFGRGS